MNGMIRTGLALAITAVIGGCGGGSGGDSSERGAAGSGDLALKITDAPVDGATAVWVNITGMRLKHTDNSGERQYRLNGEDTQNNEILVNLLELANGGSAALFAGSVTSGDYQWVRFDVESACIAFIANADPEDDNECIPMILPAQSELKTAGSFTVPINGVANITVDWDLRKGVVEQGNGSYRLKPVLHVRDDSDVGAISGTIQGAICAQDEVGAVYAFNGIVTPDDIDGTGVEPFASVRVQEDSSFYLGMLDPGTYTYALTCDALDDEPETSENILFYSADQASVLAGQVTNVIYAPLPPAP